MRDLDLAAAFCSKSPSDDSLFIEGNFFPDEHGFAIVQRDEVPALIEWLLEALTPTQRLETMRRFCRHCGDHDPHHTCSCWRDE